MTELEKIAYAKSFLDKLATGIDPTDNSPIPEGDVAAKARVVGCFTYVSDLLGTLIANPEVVNEIYKSEEWRVTPEVLASIECSHYYVSVSKFATRIDAALHSRRKFTAHEINPWLFVNGILEQVTEYDGKSVKRPTQKGIEIGFVVEQTVTETGRVRRGIRMSYAAQCFVRDHLAEIIGHAIGGNSKRSSSDRLIAFPITAEELSRFMPTERPVLITQLAYMISVLQPNPNVKLNPVVLTDWLMRMGLLEIVCVDGKNYKLPTAAGREIGISQETRRRENGDYIVALYNADAQRFIVDNIHGVIRVTES